MGCCGGRGARPPPPPPVPLLPNADAGAGRFRYLSHAAAQRFRERSMPHDMMLGLPPGGDAGGGMPVVEYVPHTFARTQMGSHACCARRGRPGSGLSRYGIGVSLYFMFVKYGAIWFGLLSLLYVPVRVVVGVVVVGLGGTLLCDA